MLQNLGSCVLLGVLLIFRSIPIMTHYRWSWCIHTIEQYTSNTFSGIAKVRHTVGHMLHQLCLVPHQVLNSAPPSSLKLAEAEQQLYSYITIIHNYLAHWTIHAIILTGFVFELHLLGHKFWCCILIVWCNTSWPLCGFKVMLLVSIL